MQQQAAGAGGHSQVIVPKLCLTSGLHVVLFGGASVSEKGIPLCSQAGEVRDLPQATGLGSVPFPQPPRQVSPLHSHTVDADGALTPLGSDWEGPTRLLHQTEFTVHMCVVPQGM